MTDLNNNTANKQGEKLENFADALDSRKLKSCIEDISGLASSQFNEIEAICKLASASLENTDHNQIWVLEAIYHAIKTIQQKAYEADYLIGKEAESAGVNRIQGASANIFRNNSFGGIQ